MVLFDYLPRMVVVQLMIIVVFYINTFIWINGLSKVLPPIMIIESIVLDFNIYFKFIFREFIQTYKETDNTITPRTIDAIALGLCGNLQGRIQCFSLLTGWILQ